MKTKPINIVNRDARGHLSGFNKMHYNNGNLNYKGTIGLGRNHIGYWEWGNYNGHIYQKYYFII